MDTCSTVPLRNISASAENQCQRISEEDNSKMEVSTSEIEMTKESLAEKNKSSKITPTRDNKNFKSKKIRIKKNKGEKRKLSEKSESAKKKIKRKKKEERPADVRPLMQEDSNIEMLSSTPLHSTPHMKMLKKGDSMVENDSDVENREVRQKSKQMSARKSKAMVNACRDTLEVLLQLESDVLGLLDKSLKILNSHNFLSNKLVPLGTLMDLISLALETSKAPDGNSQKEVSLSRIVSKLMVEMCSSPKTSKPRHSILAATGSPKTKPITQEDILVAILNEGQEMENDKSQILEEKIEESDTTLELPDKSQTDELTLDKSGKNFCITNYFKKLKRTVEERDKNERFSFFTAKTDMFIAPKLGGELTGQRREKFEEEFGNQTCEVKNLFQHTRYSSGEGSKPNKKTCTMKQKPETLEPKTSQDPTGEGGEVVVPHLSDKGISEMGDQATTVTDSGAPPRKKIVPFRVEPLKAQQPTQVMSGTKAKLIQFHDNRRPPYWGTWRRKSRSVRPRKPFGKDKLLNYEVDSDDEWESEEEPGESLHGSDDEKEPEEDYEVDNDFFVPHGYLSDDENPEKENLSPKKKLDLLEEQFTSEQKQKTRKMTPFVFGTFWVHKDLSSEGSLYQDLHIENLQIVAWTSTPIRIDEEDDKKNESVADQEAASQSKKSQGRHRMTFPDEEIPNLIKMIHGSPQNSEILARKFLTYWEEEKVQDGRRPGLTKICVLKKIKELATWQVSQGKEKRWLVPKEKRKEFGADAETESPAKKPRKCFIWKFVKRTEKSPGLGSAVASPEPEVVVLES